MTQAVRAAIIEPMLATYLPPQQVKHDPKARERALAEYLKTLAPFDQGTLERAWELVKATHELVIWPAPGIIAGACRQCEPRPKPPSEQEQRRDKALAMADTYTARYFKTSHLGRLAKREGWSAYLREYVAAAAWVQAQLICGVRNIGWDSTLAQDLGHFRSSQEAFDAYRTTIDKAVKHGRIRVTVPPARIRQWQEQAQPQQQRTAGP